MTAPGMLKGSIKDTRPLMQCKTCDTKGSENEGVEVRRGHWICRRCYQTLLLKVTGK